MTNRRSFLLGIGAALAAPAIVRAESIMPLWVPKPALITPPVLEIPSTWIPCDGRAVSRDVYADLFAVIGESFGRGDGRGTFNVPDMREGVDAFIPHGNSAISAMRYDIRAIPHPDRIDAVGALIGRATWARETESQNV